MCPVRHNLRTPVLEATGQSALRALAIYLQIEMVFKRSQISIKIKTKVFIAALLIKMHVDDLITQLP